MKRVVINLLKLGISVAILTVLYYSARDNLAKIGGDLAQMTQQPLAVQLQHWGLLGAAALLCLLMVMTTIVRWYLLVRALELPFRLRDAFRLGFLGFTLNFVSLGSVGGDLFKAIFLAREQPDHRAEAVATVIVDRVIGLYALFVVATCAVLMTGLWRSEEANIRIICHATLLCTAIGAVGILLLLIPGFTNGRLTQWLSGLPKIGHTLGRLIGAVRIYRQKLPIVLLAGVMSLGVHSLSTVGIFLAARALPGTAPSLADHFLIVPLGMLASALPLPLSGLGAMEGVVDFLYVKVSGGATVQGTGLVVVLTYRVITIGIAVIGLVYYVANRAAVARVMKEAERAAEDDELLDEVATEGATLGKTVPMTPEPGASDGACAPS